MTDIQPTDGEIVATLTESAPFDSLGPDTLAALAAVSRSVTYDDGEVVLDAFTRRPKHVFVVVEGSVRLWIEADRPHEGADDSVAGEPDETFGPGGVFGLDATLTGKAIGPLAIAAGPVRLLRVPADQVGSLFLRAPLEPAAESSAADQAAASPRYVAVDELLETDPLVVPRTMSVAQAAREMNSHGGHGFAAMELPSGQLGIVTDRMLRQRILAAGLPADTPVEEAAVTGLPRVVSGASAAEALILLLDTEADYVLVMGRDGRLRGVVEPRDFVVSSTTSGVSLHEQIRRAGSVAELQERARQMPALLGELLGGGLASAKVLTIHSAIIDTLIRRMLVLVFDDHPDLSVDAFTWLSLGSNGRREATLSSDIDCAAAFHGDVPQPEIDRYRVVFAEVTDALAVAGLSTDSFGATAAHRLFSRTNTAWHAAAQDWLADPIRNNGAMMTSLLVDGRPIHGDLGLPEVSKVFAGLRAHRGTMRLLLQESLARRAKVRGLRGLLSGGGDHFDLKKHALQPIVNLARWAALSVGSSILPTTERLRAAGGSAILPADQANALVEVFEVLQRMRLRHQLRQTEAGQEPTDILELDRVSAIDRSIITRAVREIATVQKRMDNVAHYSDVEDWNRPTP